MTSLAPICAPWVGALLTVAACYSLGSVFVGRLRITLLGAEKLPLAFVTGAALLHLVVFAILALHVAYAPIFLALMAILIVAALWTGEWRWPARIPKSNNGNRLVLAIRFLFFAIAATFAVVYIFCAWAPEISPDGTSYHLPLIARYLHAHGFEPVPASFYSTLSEGVEMIFVPAFSIAGMFFPSPAGASPFSGTVPQLAAEGSAAALVHLAFFVALALAIRAYGYRTAHPLAGEGAALLVFLSPVAGVVGTSAYVDLGTAATVFATFYFIQLWDEDRSPSLLLCIGLLGGYCYAAKYTAAIMALYGTGYVFWKTRKLRPAMFVAATAAITAAPWLLKNWIYVRNPIAPFANLLFHNPYIHPELERRWAEYLRTYGSTHPMTLPWDVIVTGATTGNLLGPVFLVLPLALLALRRDAGRRVLLPAALLCSVYFANVNPRFLLPALPFLSLALTIVCEELPLLLAILVALHGVVSWPRNLRQYAAKDAWALRRTPIQAALRRQSEDSYLSGIPNYRSARMIERTVPEGQRVLMTNGVAQFYAGVETVVSFEGASNEQVQDALEASWGLISRPSRAISFHFAERSLRRIRVVQTATMSQPDAQWSVHEMRLFSRGKEVSRDASWRLRASPNPWDVGLAFDNSSVTRWRTWEKTMPGNYVEVELPTPIPLDEVRIETSLDSAEVVLRLEEIDHAGNWSPLPVKPDRLTLTPEASLRRAAAYELLAHGIHYLFVRDDEPGADLYAADPASWGFSVLAHAEGATIYAVGRNEAGPARQ